MFLINLSKKHVLQKLIESLLRLKTIGIAHGVMRFAVKLGKFSRIDHCKTILRIRSYCNIEKLLFMCVPGALFRPDGAQLCSNLPFGREDVLGKRKSRVHTCYPRIFIGLHPHISK